ncbi:uncharacterized protein A1O9_07598 [Exophiala aquamarina CBS 119918]|uniref:Luciferase domain-containing protein n=1 Tax=Exophiala aquamarina CBS 119918 TaxID=1182545 RepID=A0A072P9Q5_9EURO|nr:uncharacterized protein A1O9_07598 [Exophiala aquamarina CBS 119918]KEF56018.1 hypothetical protein A1O9_07598 [Exophiala aquamarina CBS 119918]
MSSSYDLTFVYVLASIFIGSSIITCLLRFIKFDIQSILSTKRGIAISSLAQNIYERWLYALSVSDPLSPPARSSSSSRGYLETLPQRTGPRPSVGGTRNLKQTTQTVAGTEKDLSNRLRTVITTINTTYPHTTYLGRSTFEEGNVTLFARHRVFDHTKYYGEILNADKFDGFMSTKLHPSDVRTVIEKGWGQRHPLSSRRAAWFLCLAGQHQVIPTPESRVVLYAPRSQEDLEQIEQIIKAAVWWVGGVDSRVEQESSC